MPGIVSIGQSHTLMCITRRFESLFVLNLDTCSMEEI